jgi:nitrous oxidase accessory protein NosD
VSRTFIKPITLTILAAAALCASQTAAATDIFVPGDHATIQGAVDAAAPGDNIIVTGGTYTELVSVFTPDLAIIANDGATLNGTFNVHADGTSVKNWVINTMFHNQGIQFSNVDGCSAKNNSIYGDPSSSGDFRGIWLANATNSEVKNCYIAGHQFDAIGCFGDLTGTQVKNNVLENQTFGMLFFAPSFGAEIWNNRLINCPLGFFGDTANHSFRNNRSS